MLAQMSEDPKMANKPDQVKAKIVEGKVGKFYTENCLVDQEFVKDGSMTVKQYVDSCAKAENTTISVIDYVCFERGEGVEKKEDKTTAAIGDKVTFTVDSDVPTYPASAYNVALSLIHI